MKTVPLTGHLTHRHRPVLARPQKRHLRGISSVERGLILGMRQETDKLGQKAKQPLETALKTKPTVQWFRQKS